MPGFDEIGRLRILARESSNGFCSLPCSDARFAARVINGRHKGGGKRGGVVIYKGPKFQSLADRGQHRCTELSVALEHEIDGLGRD